MAILKLVHGTYKDNKAINNVINYIMNPDRVNNSDIIGYNIALYNAKSVIHQFYNCQYIYGKTQERKIYHLIISFGENELLDNNIPRKIIILLYSKYFYEYQCISCIHNDTNNLHIHFAFNSVNLKTGKKFNEHNPFFYEIQEKINEYISFYNKRLPK